MTLVNYLKEVGKVGPSSSGDIIDSSKQVQYWSESRL